MELEALDVESYVIDAQVNPDTQTLAGSGTMTAYSSSVIGLSGTNQTLTLAPGITITSGGSLDVGSNSLVNQGTLRGDGSVNELLILSQVVLALQLPLAMFPLLHFTSSKVRMGKWRNGMFLLIAGWTSCILITALDVYGLGGMLLDAIRGK